MRLCKACCNSATTKYTEFCRKCYKKKFAAQYYVENGARIVKQNVDYRQKRKKNDPYYRLTENMRTRFANAFRRNQKKGSAIRDLGCSMKDFKSYLESKWQLGMIWDNYGEWHVDHIRPLSSFDLTNVDDIKCACHYTNLQPLWAEDNMIKNDNFTGETI